MNTTLSRRVLTVAAVTLAGVLAACGDDSSPDGAWLDQWSDTVDRVEQHDGQPVGVDEDARMIYTQDGTLVEQLTAEGGPFGPSERDPDTVEYEDGYASACE